MAVYAVTLTILMGDYEKSVMSFREANSPDEAKYSALSGETHNDGYTFQEYQSGIEWWDDYMIYQVASCDELPPEVVNQLKRWGKVYIF